MYVCEFVCVCVEGSKDPQTHLMRSSGTHAFRLNLLRANKTNNLGFDFHFVSAWLRFYVPTHQKTPLTIM